MQARPFLFKSITTRKKYINLRKQQRKFNNFMGPRVINKGITVNHWLYKISNKTVISGKKNFCNRTIANSSKSIFYKIKNKNKLFWIIELPSKNQKPDYVYTAVRKNFFREINAERSRSEFKFRNITPRFIKKKIHPLSKHPFIKYANSTRLLKPEKNKYFHYKIVSDIKNGIYKKSYFFNKKYFSLILDSIFNKNKKNRPSSNNFIEKREVNNCILKSIRVNKTNSLFNFKSISKQTNEFKDFFEKYNNKIFLKKKIIFFINIQIILLQKPNLKNFEKLKNLLFLILYTSR